MKPLNELTISIQLNKKGLKSAQECEQMIHSDCAVYWNMGPSYCYRVNMENQQTLHENEWCDSNTNYKVSGNKSTSKNLSIKRKQSQGSLHPMHC